MPTSRIPRTRRPSDTGEPGWLEKHKGGPGGGRKKRHLAAQHYHCPAASRRKPEDDRNAQPAQPDADRAKCNVCL